MSENTNATMASIVIDDEFKNLMPPLTPAEYSLLEESIVGHGLETPLITWNGILVDGHNRYEICMKHHIPYETRCMSANNRDEIIDWIITNQLDRRNLTPYQRCEVALRLLPLYEQEAKAHQGKRHDLDNNIEQNVDRSSASLRVNQRLAKSAGLSHTTMAKAKKIQSLADDEMIDKLRKNEISISEAYNSLTKKPSRNKDRVVSLNAPINEKETENTTNPLRSLYDQYLQNINERLERGSHNQKATPDINSIISKAGACNDSSECALMLYDMQKIGDVFSAFWQNMLRSFVKNKMSFDAIAECLDYLNDVKAVIEDTGFWAGYTAKHYNDEDNDARPTE